MTQQRRFGPKVQLIVIKGCTHGWEEFFLLKCNSFFLSSICLNQFHIFRSKLLSLLLEWFSVIFSIFDFIQLKLQAAECKTTREEVTKKFMFTKDLILWKEKAYFIDQRNKTLLVLNSNYVRVSQHAEIHNKATTTTVNKYYRYK